MVMKMKTISKRRTNESEIRTKAKNFLIAGKISKFLTFSIIASCKINIVRTQKGKQHQKPPKEYFLISHINILKMNELFWS